MDYAFGVIWPIAFWCMIVTTVAIIPAVAAIFTGRRRLGGWLIAATVLPVAWFLGSVFHHLLQIAQNYPSGRLAREAPWGGMGGLVMFMPTAWCAFMLLVGAVLVTVATLRDRALRAVL